MGADDLQLLLEKVDTGAVRVIADGRIAPGDLAAAIDATEFVPVGR